MALFTFELLDFGDLSGELRDTLAVMTPPKFRCCLEGLDPYEISFARVIGVVAFADRRPVGLCLASLYLGTSMAEVFSLHVDDAYQSPGPGATDIGAQMLQIVENEAKKEDICVIVSYFRKTEPDSLFIENAFHCSNWKGPKLFMVRYFLDCKTFNPPWFNNPPKLPPNIREFPWKNLTKMERQAIEKNANQGHFRPGISPLQKEKNIEPINSLGLRYKKAVIGWMVTHRISPDTIRYSTLYIQPKFQYKGYPIRLLVDSIALQQKSPIKWSLFEINLADVDPSWIRFVMKRLAPFAIVEDKIFQVWKEL